MFRIADRMLERIQAYFCSLGLSEAEAEYLHMHYYKEYGLAIRGLVRHHTIDPLDYDKKCDGSLPLDDVLSPDPTLIDMLNRIDKSKVRIYTLTNAYKFVCSSTRTNRSMRAASFRSCISTRSLKALCIATMRTLICTSRILTQLVQAGA